MRFFHLSDLHIGKQLHYYSMKAEQEHILREIACYARELKPQAIVIAGDVYDKSVPSAEAVAVFDGFIRELSSTGAKLLVISGNHDSPERLDFASSLLERQGLVIAGQAPLGEEDFLKKVMLEDEWGEVRFWLLPFLKPAYVRGVFPGQEISSYTEAVERLLRRESLDPSVRNVLVTHQFYTGSGIQVMRSDSETVFVGGVGNVDIKAVRDFDYVAMGHIHRAQSVGESRFRYCGAPLKYSVGESEDEKSLTVVTLGKKGEEPLIEAMPLYPLHDVKRFKGTLEELLKRGCGDFVSLTLTDEILPYQPREQLERVFPNILEIRVDNTRTRAQAEALGAMEISDDPMDMFRGFYEEINGRAMSGEEEALMREIMEEAKEERA